jgi:hypothetical protein
MPQLSPRARRRALAVAVLTLALPLPAAAQVGHRPDRSPFEDVRLGQSLTLLAGWFMPGRDLAGVAPRAGTLGEVRYDIGVGGPASLFARYGIARGERDVLLPERPRATRVFETRPVSTHSVDAGLDIALTGAKTWHRLVPSLFGGAGLVGDFAKADTGGYRFGNKFTITWGGSLRFLPRRGVQLRADLTNRVFQYDYPDRYFVKGADTTSILSDTRRRSVWRGNWGASAGVILPLFR